MSSPSTHSASPIPASTAENLATRINEEAIALIKAAKAAEAEAAAAVQAVDRAHANKLRHKDPQAKLAALSNQSKIRELERSDMEISDADSETATIVVKKEDEPIVFKKKSIDPLPSPEPTEFSGVVPEPLQHTETVFTSAVRPESETTAHLRFSDEQGNTHLPATHASRLLVPTVSNSQPTTNDRQPLLDLPVEGNENFHPTLAEIKTLDEMLNRITLVNVYARLKLKEEMIDRLGMLWRLIQDPSFAAALAFAGRTVFNNQVGDLIEIFGNVISLRWGSDPVNRPGGNLDQLVVDLLRRILAADVERYYIHALHGIQEERFVMKRIHNRTHNLMQVPAWFVPSRTTPDRRWGTDFIHDTSKVLDHMRTSLRKIQDDIDAIERNGNRISGTNSEGIKLNPLPRTFKERMLRHISELEQDPEDAAWRYACYKKLQSGRAEPPPTLHHPLPIRPPQPIQWTPPPLPPLSPPRRPTPPPTTSTLSTAVNALRRSTGFSRTSSVTRRRSASKPPPASPYSSPPPTTALATRLSPGSKKSTAASRPSRGSSPESIRPTRTLSTSTRTHRSSQRGKTTTRTDGSNAVAGPSRPRPRPDTPRPTDENYEIYPDLVYGDNGLSD